MRRAKNNTAEQHPAKLTEKHEWSEVREPLEKADRWHRLHSQFMKLSKEEEAFSKINRKDGFLQAYCDYHEHPGTLQEKQKAPVTGTWMLSKGVSENLQSRFLALAIRAGLLLGSPSGADKENFWLHRLYMDLCETKSKLRLGRGKTDPDENWLRQIYPELPEDKIYHLSMAGQYADTILRVCEASATFCSRLETQALKQSESVEVLSAGARKGRDVLRIKEELKKIKRGKSNGFGMGELRIKYPQFLVWTIADRLPKDERETFNHPGTWGPGYAVEVFLKNHYDRSPATMKKWIDMYRKESGTKTGQKKLATFTLNSRLSTHQSSQKNR